MSRFHVILPALDFSEYQIKRKTNKETHQLVCKTALIISCRPINPFLDTMQPDLCLTKTSDKRNVTVTEKQLGVTTLLEWM